MDILQKRIQKVVESVVENEALIGGLDEDAAEDLQQWGIQNATSVAKKTASLNDDSLAEREMYPMLKASRRLLRAVGSWLEHHEAVDENERQRLWGKLEASAKLFYGAEITLPAPSELSGASQAAFIQNLRKWLEGESKDDGRIFHKK